jgi:hypothetical protein
MNIHERSFNLPSDGSKKAAQQKAAEGMAFSAALEASTKQVGGIMAAEESHKQHFKQKKITTDKLNQTEEEESEDQTVATSVRKLAKKLKSLAELERKALGL